jgi:TolB-like protein
MGDFFAELRRRHIYRIGAGYVIVAWAIAQVVDLLSQIFALPDWIAQPVVVVLAIGFPVTLVVAWLIEGQEHKAETTGAASPASKVDWVIAGGLALVLAVIGYQQFSPRTSEIASTLDPDSVAATIADEIVEDIADRLPNSIAVLPFENVSPDPDDAYFAVGVHDAILTQLSKLQNVNVIGRTSVLQYPGSGKTIPEIADELNVEMVMEGSVRYAGDQVQVTARLLDGMTNNLMWTEPYDGDLSDIFGIQAEIAMNIANSLRADFSVAEQESIEAAPTDSLEAYNQYLKAISLIRNDVVGGGDETEAARQLVQRYLDEALVLDPEFALAHAYKGLMYVYSQVWDVVAEENWLDHSLEMNGLALAHTDMALALEPNLGAAYAVRAWVNLINWRAGPAQADADRAFQLAPNDPTVLDIYALVNELIPGRLEDAVRIRERQVQLDPINFDAYDAYGEALHFAGRYDEAVEAFQECNDLSPPNADCFREMTVTEFVRSNSEAALDSLRRLDQRGGGRGNLAFLARGYGLFRLPADAQRIFEEASVRATEEYIDPMIWAWIHMGVGNYDEALTELELVAENPGLVRNPTLAWYTARNYWNDPMLEQPEFVEVRTRLLPRF